jgi:outer membrane protein, heavy metal efflux system
MIFARACLPVRVPGWSLTSFIALLAVTVVATGQSPLVTSNGRPEQKSFNAGPLTNEPNASSAIEGRGLSSSIGLYSDPVQGASSEDLVRRALASNLELAAARLDIERARARLRQAGLRPNPSLDLEQTTGRFTGSADERESSVGISLPFELGGKRRRRIELAQAELEAAEAEVADRERRLASEVFAAHAEALAALRELQITEEINNVNTQTTVFIQTRVNEGETAPLELNLIRAEVDRLRSQRRLVEGRLQAAFIRLKNLAGIPLSEPLRLREDLARPLQPKPPATLEAAIEIALRTRPDLQLARLTEDVAQAGLRLARAQGVPDMTVSTRYSSGRSLTDLPEPLVPLPDEDRLLTFGVSVGIPVFNRNQGGKAEAATAISQARKRREFLEQVVGAEVASAYQRYDAAQAAAITFEQGVIARSTDNIRVIRAAYQIGEFRITDVLNEQRRLLDSQREFTEALTEQYRALVDLRLAMGLPVNSGK